MAAPADQSYRERLLGLLGERNPIEALPLSARRIEEVVRGLGSAGLAKSYAPGKWTGAQIVAHLADAEVGIGFRTRQAQAEDNHTVQPFDQEVWARRYVDVDHEVALRSFLALRDWNLSLFRTLGASDLERPVFHPERGAETVAVMIRMLAGHDLNHLAQLERIAADAR